ncbi:MAG: transposase [Actinomycetota bacterium]|nr:transposase [Actinomycetota bacterium]
MTTAVTLIDRAIAGCAADDVDEIQSLSKTLSSWRAEIIAHHRTGASNGPTEGQPGRQEGEALRQRLPLVHNYRLRVLLHAGGIRWPERAKVPSLRTRSPS